MDLLIVDDDAMALAAIHRLLLDIVPAHWSIAPVSDALAGRSLLTLDPRIKVAIIDYLMPRLDGLALVEDALKYRPELRGKIIITSGAAIPEDIEQRLFEELGCIRLDKPVDADALELVIHQITTIALI